MDNENLEAYRMTEDGEEVVEEGQEEDSGGQSVGGNALGNEENHSNDETDAASTQHSQQTEYHSAPSSPTTPAASNTAVPLVDRLARERSLAAGTTSTASASHAGQSTQFSPPASALSHPNPNPTRATPRRNAPPKGTPTAPRAQRRPSQVSPAQQHIVSGLLRE
ncbi:hypothetical protein V5O48_016565 [Marasmius crinis-equi]|uniref:Uncharacterized protein n=1 Tax=Marasmius crinis-equi TaxID=585013 RepID=A0ABR3ERD1_9AGAR